jgi:PAS domain S-box-containing protein
MELHNQLTSALSTGDGKSNCEVVSQQLTTTGKMSGDSVRRYEQLVNAAKAFIFTVIIKEKRAVCTIHYPGVLQVTGYSEEEYARQPLLWYRMIHPEDRGIVLQQIEQLYRGETPPPIKHRIIDKGGGTRWLKNTSIPLFDEQGILIAYDGLVVDISGIEHAEEAQDQRIASLTASLAMFKNLHHLLPICCSCKKIRDSEGAWQSVDAYITDHYPGIAFTHGICPACAQKLYPEYCPDTVEAALVSRLVDDIRFR